MKRGQISTEVLIIIGILLLLLIPLLLYAYSKAGIASEDLAVQKAEFAAQRLASLSDSVGYLGGAAAVIDEIEIPPYVKSVKVNGYDIVIEMDSTAGKKEIVKSSEFLIKEIGFENITKAGTYFIEVKALSNYTQGAEQVQMSLK